MCKGGKVEQQNSGRKPCGVLVRKAWPNAGKMALYKLSDDASLHLCHRQFSVRDRPNLLLSFDSISSFLFSCYEKATEALCIGRIPIRLELSLIRVLLFDFAGYFFNLMLVRFHQVDNYREASYQGRNNETGVGVEPSTLRSWLS